jgi:hypothetical protein
MNKHVLAALVSSAALSATLLAPTAAHAVIGDVGGGDDGGGGGVGGGGGTSTPSNDINKHFSWEQAWGNTSWGAGIYAGGGVTATAAANLTERDKASGTAVLEAYAKINGSRYRLLNLRATASGEYGRTSSIRASAALFGAEFWSFSRTNTGRGNVYGLIGEGWDKTMFDRSVGIWVGPVPVTFTAKVTGRLGAGLNAAINVTRIGATFQPTARASLYASAAVGGEYCLLGMCAGASAGLYTDLNLFDLSVPSSFEVGLTPVNNGAGLKVNYNLRSDVTFSSLDGELGAFAEAHLGDLSYEWSTVLLSWTGISMSAPLVAQSGTGCLVGNCMTTVDPGAGMLR